eukprot:TRINITY_DN78518_c0_g1_i1.p1 TRINITY_DN78518_c0_g1~~TRINITY_DN78518_c0_g1_i1.p1  ORF type:complete len:255 (-),score=29.97 TRINITY_DN78518_c0_g1_i1:24-752(-)
MAEGDILSHHPSALRNRIPILKELLRLFNPSDTFHGLALEIASGTGAHMEVYAPAFPRLCFQPSEYIPKETVELEQQWPKYGKIGLTRHVDELVNIDAHCSEVFANVRRAVALDMLWPWESWPSTIRHGDEPLVLILCSNTLHISPWECSVNLIQNAGLGLAPGGHLVIYGAFKEHGQYLGKDGGAGNAHFDQKLRETNPAWGLRDLSELTKLAAEAGMSLEDKVDMPANNSLLHYVKKREE